MMRSMGSNAPVEFRANVDFSLVGLGGERGVPREAEVAEV
jgi:hypothetical protein